MFACVEEYNEKEELLDDIIDKGCFYSKQKFWRKNTYVAEFQEQQQQTNYSKPGKLMKVMQKMELHKGSSFSKTVVLTDTFNKNDQKNLVWPSCGWKKWLM